MSKVTYKKGTFTRLMKYLRAYIPLIVLSIILSAITVLLTLYIPVLCGRTIDCFVGTGNVDFDGVFYCLAQICVCASVCGVIQWIFNTVNNKITYSVIRDVRRDAFSIISRLPLSYIDSHPHGKIVSRIISDVDQFADGLLLGFTQLFSGIMTILCTIGFMISLNVGIAIVVIVLTPLSLIVASFIAKRIHDMFVRQSETRAELTGRINETLGAMNVIHSFSAEERMKSEFSEVNARLEKYTLRATFFSSLVNPSTRFINNIVYAAVCLTGSLSVLAGGITVGGLTSFLAYANQYTKPFNEISGVVTELQNALACAERLFELMDEPLCSEDLPDAKILDENVGEVTLENVSFSYSKDKKLIENLNLKAKSGSRIAIVGPTGCGKTTLINLLMRFYETDGGKISVEGKDIRNVTISSLRGSYGMVLQDTWLMHGTVMENIRLGRDSTDEEVVAAAEAAHADSFIRRLPDGYNTVISDDGGTLSAGQRQLICIARVMLRIPPMLILDEATSSIDTRTELKIQSAFAKMMKGRTSFIVAHRLSTIKNADTIIVMREGHIEEQGTHDELLKKGGFYSVLWNSQFEHVQ